MFFMLKGIFDTLHKIRAGSLLKETVKLLEKLLVGRNLHTKVLRGIYNISLNNCYKA